MKTVKQSVMILKIDSDLKLIEQAARVCYKSENLIKEGSDERIVGMLMDKNHTAMIEHSFASVKIVCDRGVSHELVRHRLFSYAQESTRYCNYSKDKFNKEITVIYPCYFPDDRENPVVKHWLEGVSVAESKYFAMLENGATPEQARGVLPTCLKTEIVVSGNFREWLHFFKLRTTKYAHPQIVEIARIIYRDFNARFPVIFNEETIKND